MKENLPPRKLSRDGFIHCHSSFRELRSKNDNSDQSNKRKLITDISNSTNKNDSNSTQSSNLISPDIKNKKRMQVIN